MAHQPTAASGSSTNSSLQFLNSPFGDTTYTKVFVGGLAWETQSETLYRYFIQFGEILEAVVITDKHTGKSKGYGFVTFRDPESARKACTNSGPVIDGRRANCNLASLGRIRPFPPHGNLRSATPFLGVPRGTYDGSPTYHQSVTHSYPQGYGYSPFMYAYGSEYAYPQGFYNPYTGQQYIQMYSLPGTIGSSVYPFGQFGQPIPSGHRYNPVQGYAIPPLHVMQLNSSSVFGVTQPQYSTGPSAPTPAQTQFMVSASPKFMHGSGSDQTTG